MHEGEQTHGPTYTEEQVKQIVELVTEKLRTAQSLESDERINGRPLPETIVEELDYYAETNKLQKAIQKFKKETQRYNDEEWVTAETINPNFTNNLKQYKLDAFQHVSAIYKYAEITRVQARAATAIYEKLESLRTRGFQPGDEVIISQEVESLRRLAAYGFGAAKIQEGDAKEVTLKTLKLPPSLKHLESQEPSGDKKYAFDTDFLEQYYDESHKHGLLTQTFHNKGNYSNKSSTKYGYNNRGSRGGYDKSRPFRGRGRGAGSQHTTTFRPNQPSTPTPNPDNQ